MNIKIYDEEKAIYITLREGVFNYGKDITDQIHLNYGQNDEILGLEILNESDDEINIEFIG